VKGTELREKIRSLLGQPADEMGNTQWIGHVLKRLQLIDNSPHKHHVGGKLYAIERPEVLDMMQRYDVPQSPRRRAAEPAKIAGSLREGDSVHPGWGSHRGADGVSHLPIKHALHPWFAAASVQSGVSQSAPASKVQFLTEIPPC
jgi:hypothetical protein